MCELIFLEPVLKETIWGGSRIGHFGVSLPSDHVGELWAVCAHSNGDNRITEGRFAGYTLGSLWKSHPELFGEDPSACRKFPLLTKILDARDDLSIQVHPDDEYAAANENGSFGKTEHWYILDAEPGTSIVIGHNACDREQVRQMIEERKWDQFIRQVSVKKGDSFFIEPGTVHAIKGGTLILETQQSSDITYRVYDYDRMQNGKPRQLHLKESMDVITAPFVQKQAPLNPGKSIAECSQVQQIVSCDKFTVWHADVDGRVQIMQNQKFLIVTVVEGSGSIDGTRLSKGDSFIMPHGYGTACFEGSMELVISCE